MCWIQCGLDGGHRRSGAVVCPTFGVSVCCVSCVRAAAVCGSGRVCCAAVPCVCVVCACCRCWCAACVCSCCVLVCWCVCVCVCVLCAMCVCVCCPCRVCVPLCARVLLCVCSGPHLAQLLSALVRLNDSLCSHPLNSTTVSTEAEEADASLARILSCFSCLSKISKSCGAKEMTQPCLPYPHMDISLDAQWQR